MSSIHKTGWYVLYVRSKYEKKVALLLKEIHLESFLPTIKKTRQWSDRKKILDVPLFPSYIFVKINSSVNYQKALSIKGVCGYVRFGRDYAIVRDSEINNIKLLLLHQGFQKNRSFQHNAQIQRKLQNP